MPGDRAMKEALDAQDGLYTLVVKHADGTYEPRVIGSIVEYLFAPDDPEAVIEKLCDGATRIVSLTVTEGGYSIDQISGDFVPAGDVEADLEPGAVPRSAFGLIVEALRRRRSRGVEPFTVMSCDNLQGNGHLSRRAFTAFASLRDPELGAWVAHEVRFPNSMVDRITPVTTDEDRAEVRERFGVDDRWPVVCEPFTQWVLEDSFSLGRPPYEDAGVQVVEDVEPYELMKLRLLNASHQALCYFAYLDGYRLVHEAAQDPLFREFLRGYMDLEGDADAGARARGRRRGVQGDADRALLEPGGPRHDRAAVRRELGPHPEVAAAGGACAARVRRPDRGFRPRWWRAGRATPRASTSRASRSRSSTGSRIR